MKKIAVDARSVATENPRGMARVTLDFVRYLSEHPQYGNKFELLCFVDNTDQKMPDVVRRFAHDLGPSNPACWEQHILSGACRSASIDLLFCTTNTAPWRVGRQTKLVTVIHDTMFKHRLLMTLRRGTKRQIVGMFYRRLFARIAAKKSKRILTVSNYSKRCIASEYTLNADQIKVITPSVEHIAQVKAEVDIYDTPQLHPKLRNDAPFILYVGGNSWNKNAVLAPQVLEWLRKNGQPDMQLVMIGIPENGREKLSRQADGKEIEGIIFGHGISDEVLAGLYRSAVATLVTSIEEGFCLPVVEAVSVGCPVVTTVAGAAGEIAGDAGLVVESATTETLGESLIRVMEDRDLRERMITDGYIRASHFTRESSARSLENAIGDIVESVISK